MFLRCRIFITQHCFFKDIGCWIFIAICPWLVLPGYQISNCENMETNFLCFEINNQPPSHQTKWCLKLPLKSIFSCFSLEGRGSNWQYYQFLFLVFSFSPGHIIILLTSTPGKINSSVPFSWLSDLWKGHLKGQGHTPVWLYKTLVLTTSKHEQNTLSSKS